MALFPAVANAQSVISCEQDRLESCDPGNDGAAIVRMPTALTSYTTVEWTTPTGGHLTGRYVTVNSFIPNDVRTGSRARVLGIDDECRLLIEYEDKSREALSSGEVSVLLTP